MNNQQDPQQKEDKAIQALITATLHVRGDDVRPEEIQPYLEQTIVLSTEDEAALRKLGPDPLASAVVKQSGSSIPVPESDYAMAMNRKKPDSGFSAKTSKELDRKRQELLAKLRKKQNPS